MTDTEDTEPTTDQGNFGKNSSEKTDTAVSDRSTDRLNSTPSTTPAAAASIPLSGIDSLASSETPAPQKTGNQPRHPKQQRLGKHRADMIASSLNQRDKNILASLKQHRFLTSRQLERWHFSPMNSATRTCLRVLDRLRTFGLITTLDRRLGGIEAGSSGYSWHLSQTGTRLIAGNTPGRRIREPSLAFLEHELGIAETHLQLIEASRTKQIDLVDVATEPACWRIFLGSGGQTITLKPDLFAITAHGESETLFFAEYDRGSESIQTIVKKAMVFEAYRNSGLEQRRSGTFPYVLWIVPTSQRKQRIIRALGSAAIRQPELHLVATYDEATTTIIKTSQEGGDQ